VAYCFSQDSSYFGAFLVRKWDDLKKVYAKHTF
jgi:hypothetical protein